MGQVGKVSSLAKAGVSAAQTARTASRGARLLQSARGLMLKQRYLPGFEKLGQEVPLATKLMTGSLVSFDAGGNVAASLSDYKDCTDESQTKLLYEKTHVPVSEICNRNSLTKFPQVQAAQSSCVMNVIGIAMSALPLVTSTKSLLEMLPSKRRLAPLLATEKGAAASRAQSLPTNEIPGGEKISSTGLPETRVPSPNGAALEKVVNPADHPPAAGLGPESSLGYKDGKTGIASVNWRTWDGSGTVPFQGYKVHVSATVENLAAIQAKVLPILRKFGIHHKVIGSADELARLEGGQAGKAIVTYPKDAKQAAQLAKELDEALKSTSPSSFPKIHGETSVGSSGGVFVRYGSFLTDSTLFNVNSMGHIIDKKGRTLLRDPLTQKLSFTTGQPLTVDEMRYLKHRAGNGDFDRIEILKRMGIVIEDRRGTGRISPWPEAEDPFLREFRR